MSHPREHEDALQACLATDDPARALASSAASGCAACTERMDELLSVTEVLGAIGRDARAGAAARGAVGDQRGTQRGELPGERRVAEFLGPRLAARGRSRRLALASLACAAAAAALLALFWFRRADPPAGAGATLGPARLELAAPGVDGERLVLSWSAELPPNGTFEVRVADRDGRELARATTEAPRWTTPPTADWPREVVWHVDVLDASGARLEARSSAYSLR